MGSWKRELKVPWILAPVLLLLVYQEWVWDCVIKQALFRFLQGEQKLQDLSFSLWDLLGGTYHVFFANPT